MEDLRPRLHEHLELARAHLLGVKCGSSRTTSLLRLLPLLLNHGVTFHFEETLSLLVKDNTLLHRHLSTTRLSRHPGCSICIHNHHGFMVAAAHGTVYAHLLTLAIRLVGEARVMQTVVDGYDILSAREHLGRRLSLIRSNATFPYLTFQRFLRHELI